jgi:hypothetical protein
MHVCEVHTHEVQPVRYTHAHEMYAHKLHAHEMHAREVRAYKMHAHKTHAYPTVVRWSICRDLSCRMRVFALRDKGPYGPPQPPPIEGRKIPPLGATFSWIRARDIP